MESYSSDAIGLLGQPGFFDNEVKSAGLNNLSSDLNGQKERVLRLLDEKEGFSQVEICGPSVPEDVRQKEVDFWKTLLGQPDSIPTHPENVIGSEQINVYPTFFNGFELRIMNPPGNDQKSIALTLAKVGAPYGTRS